VFVTAFELVYLKFASETCGDCAVELNSALLLCITFVFLDCTLQFFTRAHFEAQSNFETRGQDANHNFALNPSTAHATRTG
jgi:hypothetical protein